MIDLAQFETVNVDLNDNEIIFNTEIKRLDIKTKNFVFETMYIPNNNSNELLVLLCSGERKSKKTRFDRWSMYGYCNKNIICIEDPMYKLHGLVTGWYFGSKEHSVVHELKLIICKLLDDRKIERNNVCIIGSSCGAHAAIHLTYLLSGCLCIAMNPQLVISNFGKSSVSLAKRVNMSLETDEDSYMRNDLTYFTDDKASKYYIICNKLVKRDWDQQVYLLFKKLNPLKVDFSDNLYVKENIIFYISNNKYTRAHSNVIDSLGLLFINNILKQSTVDFTAIQSIMNVQEKNWDINDYYKNHLYWKEFLKNVWLGNYLACPVIEKNKLIFSTLNESILIAIVSTAKYTKLSYTITCPDRQSCSDLCAMLERECIDLCKGIVLSHNKIIKFSNKNDLKDNFLKFIAVINKYLMLNINIR